MRRVLLICLLALLSITCVFSYDFSESIKIATTTSLDNTGLLDFIVPDFEKKFNIKTKIIATGTGKALALAKNKDVDLILVHNKKAELEFLKNGYGFIRQPIMFNYFIIVGPKNDKQAGNSKSLDEALKNIFNTNKIFVSRGDNSGTNMKEKELIEKHKIKIKRDNYRETGQGMLATLKIANELNAYTLTDKSTFLSAQDKLNNLDILYEKDDGLYNEYSIILLNPYNNKNLKYYESYLFFAWINSPETKIKIKNFRKYNKQLFYPVF